MEEEESENKFTNLPKKPKNLESKFIPIIADSIKFETLPFNTIF